MAYVALDRFLFRAPLLPSRTLTDGGPGALDRHPLGRAALALASPELNTASASANGADDKAMARVGRAVDRYRRRAAFRPTPHGLWAGVGLGSLGPRTAFKTGQPGAVFRVAWKRLADLARTLLTDVDVRAHVRLRHAPSVIQGARTVVWLGSDDGDGVDTARLIEKRADCDALVGAVLKATSRWTPWPKVRIAVAPDADENDDMDEVDDLLLTMVDDGLLHFDLVPPLLGPPPANWMIERLGDSRSGAASLSRVPAIARAVEQLLRARDAADRGDFAALQATLAALPAALPSANGIQATLIFRPRQAVTLSRTAVTRAARLAPLLFRLQEALAPPAMERTPDPALADALDATTEILGAGALDLGALALGDYGVETCDRDPFSRPAAKDSPGHGLLTLLVDRIVEAARDGLPTVTLSSENIEPLLPTVDIPATCELFLAPCKPRAGKPPGEGWLLGLHAPAGASWGRFAHALPDGGATLLEPLRTAELRARPGERRMDVIFAPSDGLGDICAHPPLRPTALALTGWPNENADALTVTLADLELCADAGALEPLALRTTTGVPVAPSALHRVRSTTAPGGIWRLLVGWNLYRQHAPWAVTLGPLGDLDWTPRIVIDGFVVAPASWRVPPDIAARGASARHVRAWRKRAALPRFVQVGSEDELLPVDLTTPLAAADLVGQSRVFEIWPPLDDTPDASGRRVEAVVALADEPNEESRARMAAILSDVASAGAVPPPRKAAPSPEASGWQTFKLFGGVDHQDALLIDDVAPTIREARAAREITGWFFLRYVDGPGLRTHLRLRVRTAKAGDPRFSRRLNRRLAFAWKSGDVVSVEQASYFPEVARFGGASGMAAAHALFQADSGLACTLLALEAAAGASPGADAETGTDGGAPGIDGDFREMVDLPEWRLLCLVATFDSLSRGFGLDLDGRRHLARRRLGVHATEIDTDTARAHGQAFRTLAPHLRKLLSGNLPAPIAVPLDDYRTRALKATRSLDPDTRRRIIAPILHLSTVRLVGLDRPTEIRAYDLWTRTLESLARHPPP